MTDKERTLLYEQYLGKTVSVVVDRPLGSMHPSHRDIIYSVNYGYIPGTLGGDGEEIDAYILGVDVPLTSFEGKVVAVIRRLNDDEDKLVVAPAGAVFYQNDICAAVRFQEQYFKSEVFSLYQKSCGAVIYRRKDGGVEFLLLLQKRSRTWSFPKGHMEYGEDEHKCALREIYEEVGIKSVIQPGFREEVNYVIRSSINKKVVLFLAEAQESDEPVIRDSEILEFRWVSANEAAQLLNAGYAPLIRRLKSLSGKKQRQL